MDHLPQNQYKIQNGIRYWIQIRILSDMTTYNAIVDIVPTYGFKAFDRILYAQLCCM